MLQRESKTLERAFEQAGLKSNGDDLQFSLRRDNGQQQQQPQQGNGGSGTGKAATADNAADVPDVTVQAALQRLSASRAMAGGVDIQI